MFASARTLWARAFLRTPYAVRAPFLFRLLKRAELWTDPVPLRAPTVDLSLSLLARLASGGLIFLITITCSCALLCRFLPSSHPGYINACICCYKPHHDFGIGSPFRLCTLSIYEVVSAYENSHFEDEEVLSVVHQYTIASHIRLESWAGYSSKSVRRVEKMRSTGKPQA